MANDDAGWKPVLSADGQFYCSPGCGGCKFCRKEWYDHAVKIADDVCAELGAGWEPSVHENLGWYARAHKGYVTVYINEDRSGKGHPSTYSAWIEPKVLIGRSVLQIIADGPTAMDAVGNATQDARTVMARLNEALSILSDTIAA